MIVLFLPSIAYLIGAIPMGFIIARCAGFADITQLGSGNIGATNVARIAGKKYFLLVFLADAAKAFLYLYFLQCCEVALSMQYLCALFLILGNSFSLFLGGKGGKGVATSVGIMAAFNIYVLCAMLFLWLCGVMKTRNIGISSVITLFLLPIFVFVLVQQITDFFLLTLFISWWGIWRHAENIKQFLKSFEAA